MIQNRSKVAVLMAAYNGANFIEEQIRTILNQENVDIVLHVSDDNSNDNTQELVNFFVSNHQRVKLYKNETGTGSGGQNFMQMFRTIDIMDADYISFADQDDLWLPKKLFTAIKSIKKTGASGYSSSVEAFWENGKKSIISQSSKQKKFDFLFEGAGQGCTFVITRDLFLTIKKFCNENRDITDKFYYHDWLTYILCRSHNKKWFFDRNISLKYRQHDNNDTGSRASFRAVLHRLKLIKSGWYRDQIFVALDMSMRIKKNKSDLKRISSLLRKRRTIFNKFSIIFFVLMSSRRKLKDRILISISVLFSYI